MMVSAADPWRPLIDRFGRRHTYLRISLTDRCNFRCQYCMPAEGVELTPRSEVLSLEEILRLARVFIALGVDKIRLTGGEPTLRRGLVGLIESLRGLGPHKLLMTTNGYTLAQSARDYRRAGLDGLNVSLDSLQAERFGEITRGARLERVLAGLEAACGEGYSTLKVNVVVMAGVNDDELCDFVQFGLDRNVEVRFIEFMPFLGNAWSRAGVVSYREMLEKISEKFNLESVALDKTEVAKHYTVEGRGRVGFVTSVTDDFCEGCNRIRLTTEGRIKTCLFLRAERSLRDLMRAGSSDEELALSIHSALDGKWAGHPPLQEFRKFEDRAMVQIGG